MCVTCLAMVKRCLGPLFSPPSWFLERLESARFILWICVCCFGHWRAVAEVKRCCRRNTKTQREVCPPHHVLSGSSCARRHCSPRGPSRLEPTWTLSAEINDEHDETQDKVSQSNSHLRLSLCATTMLFCVNANEPCLLHQRKPFFALPKIQTTKT